jgi:hypothetical protein
LANRSYSFRNINEGGTLSGLSIYLLDLPQLEWYRDIFMDVVDHDPKRAEKLLHEMKDLSGVGDFIYSGEEQILELAVFGLILMDRLICNFEAKRDGWESMVIYDQMMECQEYIRLPDAKLIRRESARNAAHMRHKEHRDFKRDVIEYYAAHQHEFRSMDAAAEAIVSRIKLVPVTFRTVRAWIKEYRKQLQSARKA